MKLRILIIEDDPMVAHIHKHYLNELKNFEIVDVIENGLLGYEYLQKNSDKIDLVILDVHMPKMSGLDFLRSLPTKPHIVITTAYREYAVESFDLDVLDYLVKPIPFGRFLKAITKINNRINIEKEKISDTSFKEEPFIFLKVDKKLMKIKLNDI